MLHKHNVRLILAFPGSGKTTCVKGLRETGNPSSPPIACDMDIKGLGGSHCDIHRIPKSLNVMGELINQLMKEGVIVFSFLNYANLDCLNRDSGRVLVFIPPVDRDLWAEKIRARGDSDSFVELVRRNFYVWRDDWMRTAHLLARRLDVHAVELRDGEYLSDALYRYLTNYETKE